STHIVKSDSLMEIGLGDLYSERALANGVTTEKADLTFASLPYRIMHEFQIPLYDQIKNATRTSTSGWRTPDSTSTSVMTSPVCSSSTCAAARATTSMSERPSSSPMGRSGSPRGRSTT